MGLTMPKVPDGVDLDALRRAQIELAGRVRIEDDLPEPVEVIAGFDASYDRAGRGYGALTLLGAGDLEVLELHLTEMSIELPYIPGLLAYREMPLLEALWPELELDPDVLLVDGGGLIHPRRLGSACHMGVRLDVPAVGVTKSLLLGEVDGTLASHGDQAPIVDDGEVLGYALRSSRRATKPIYVSPGHRVSHETALRLVRTCLTGRHKLPEPIWLADREAGKLKRGQT